MMRGLKKIYDLAITCILFTGVFLSGCRSANYPHEVETKQFPVPQGPFAPKSYVVYKTAGPIRVDGNMDERSWKQARWTDDFVAAKGGDAPAPRYETNVKLLWDENYLYVGAALKDDNLWAHMTKRDASLYLDNAFEIFIDPDKDTHNYVEFEINALGTIWDLFLSGPYRDAPQVLNDYNLLDYQSAICLDGEINDPKSKDEGWTLEYAIPLTSILALDADRRSIRNGDQWKVNFQRAQRRLGIIDNQYQKEKNPNTGKPYGPDFWVWSPQGLNDIHYPEMWGNIQFSEVEAGQRTSQFNIDPSQKYRWALRRIYYQMKNFRLNHGHFADNLNDLHLEKIKVKDLPHNFSLQTTASLFEVTLPDKQSDYIWHINQVGRVWKNRRSKQ